MQEGHVGHELDISSGGDVFKTGEITHLVSAALDLLRVSRPESIFASARDETIQQDAPLLRGHRGKTHAAKWDGEERDVALRVAVYCAAIDGVKVRVPTG